MSGHRAPEDYDERLLKYITDTVRKNKVPPTIDEIITNVDGISSKSTVYSHCQRLVDAGLLTQKNIKGYYYPTSLDAQEVLVPIHLLEEIGRALVKNPENILLAKKLQNLIV